MIQQREIWHDEYESWLDETFNSRMDDGYYNQSEQDYDDVFPTIPNGSYMDDLSINDDDSITIID